VLNIQKKCDQARYTDILEHLVNELCGEEILRLEYESSWSGDVDIDVLLKNGQVFSYYYSYGSCSGCDEWESLDLDDEEIEEEMLKGATFFDDIAQYNAWRKTVDRVPDGQAGGGLIP
jgi:hypothetical protein